MVSACKRHYIIHLTVCLLVVLAFSAVAHAEAYRLVTKWGSNGSADGQFFNPYGVAVDAQGNVYVADTYNHRIQKFTSSGTFLTKWGSGGSGDGEFNYPTGVAVDASGNVYVAGNQDHRIQKFTSTGTFVTEWGSEGTGDGNFKYPQGLAVDTSANVYVADRSNRRIQKSTSTGAFLARWGSLGADDGEFDEPSDVALDASDNVYVADESNNRIQKFTSAGAFLTKWGANGSGDGQFSAPRGVAVDATANVYVADLENHRIQKFTSAGVFLTKWGSEGSGKGQFSHPRSVAVDASGNVYVADTENHRIQKFAPVVQLSWLKGTGYDGTDGCHPDSGTAGNTLFKFKCRLTDADGDEPEYVRLVLHRNGRLYKKLTMSPGGGPTTDGRKYARNLRLAAGNWKYRITAKDNDGTDTTGWRTGPAIASGPYLEWAGTSGYTTDGVDPDTGSPGETTFTFKVKYIDHDGDMPTYVKVRILKDGVSYKKKAMTTADTSPDPTTGIVYGYETELPTGTYEYRFLALDGDGKATGPAREQKSGPTIEGGSGTLAVTSLSAAPTAAGAQVTFSLSAQAQVQARVLNIAGRPVKTICTARACEAGPNTLLWNAQSDAGLAVPSGTYVVEVVARAADGPQARGLARVVLRR